MIGNLAAGLFGLPGLPFIATGGNEVKTVGIYRYHFFTSNGTFAVTQGTEDIEICGIGGGAAGGTKGHAGGGGAGELDLWTLQTNATGSYSVTIGAGGTGSADQTVPGASGGTTSFASVVTSLGGGGGGSRQQSTPANTGGVAGGSGGGV